MNNVFEKMKAKKIVARATLFSGRIRKNINNFIHILNLPEEKKEELIETVRLAYIEFEMTVIGYTSDRIKEFIEVDLKNESVQKEIMRILEYDSSMIDITDRVDFIKKGVNKCQKRKEIEVGEKQ